MKQKSRLRHVCTLALDALDTHSNMLSNDMVESMTALRSRLEDEDVWPAEAFDDCETLFDLASSVMGDHAMWNHGGQGYVAMKLLRKR